MIDEIYEKDLVAEGYSTSGDRRRLIESDDDMAELMTELASAIQIEGYSGSVEELITFNKDGKVIPNDDLNGNGRRLFARERRLSFFKKTIKKIGKEIGRGVNNLNNVMKKNAPLIIGSVMAVAGAMSGNPALVVSGFKLGSTIGTGYKMVL